MRRNFLFALGVIGAYCMVGLGLQQANAQDITEMSYMLEAMNSWSSCSSCSNISGLSYTDDQINQLDTQLREAGMTKLYKYFDTQVDNTDLLEDSLHVRGADHRYADNAEVYALSSHGNAPTVDGVQLYTAFTCNSTELDTCEPRSDAFVFGEQTSAPGFGTNPGKMRWLMLATCYSVHTQPSQQWALPYRYGLDMIMGYRGTSMDSEMTDEVLADFAESAFRGESKFKKVWFSATEDWWIDDTSSIITCHGTNTGTTVEELEDRLNNYTRLWPKRLNNGVQRVCTWAWHEG